MLKLISPFLCLLICGSLGAQVRFNEAVNSNGEHRDEDDDTPDWFELYNAGPEINLAGWTISDDADEPGKWTVPDLTIPAGGHQLIWASGKDRASDFNLRTFVRPGDECKFIIPDANTSFWWLFDDFPDDDWPAAPSGIGYGDGPYNTEVPAGTAAVFIRHEFTVFNVDDVAELLLDVDYNDGFVAYLNDREIARANMEGTRPPFDARPTALADSRSAAGLPPERFIPYRDQLQLRNGVNVLSIQVHNFSDVSSDLTMFAYLTARFNNRTTQGAPPPEALRFGEYGPHTNFKLSAAGETLYLFDPAGNLVDELEVAGIPANISIGFSPGGGPARTFEQTTPGFPNTTRGYLGRVNERVTFSRASGEYEPFTLTLSGAAEGAMIRYTTDASTPTNTSPVYVGPLAIQENTVVRARIFSGEKRPSPIHTESYLIGVDHDLDVVSIATDPAGFFGQENGIYAIGYGADGGDPYPGANFWRDLETPGHFSFFPKNGGPAFSQDIGLKIFGGFSRRRDQRSLSVFARNRYGDGDMDYPFFDTREYDEFKSIILRNSGNDWMQTMIRDVTMTGIMDGSGLDVQAYRPVATYINGQYWGFYNMREKVNEDFLASRHGVDPDSVDILEYIDTPVEGSNEEYVAMLDFLRANELFDQANYDRVANEIDVDNFIMYQIAQIYYGNQDWPLNNIKFWRAQRPGAKWRWILYDTDFGLDIWGTTPPSVNGFEFALATDGPAWPNPPLSTLLARRMMGNPGFRDRFINQFADEMNSRFLFDNVNTILSGNADRVRTEIGRAFDRWDKPNDFDRKVEDMRDYLRQRPAYVKGHILDYFQLPAYHETRILLDNPAEGYVQINSLKIEDSEWSGDYFEGVPIQLEAIANEGYVFSHWALGSASDDAAITVGLTEPTTFKPVFRSDGTSVWPAGGSSGLTSIENLVLSPNPVTSVARLSFTTKRRTRVSAQLYDARGVLVRTVADRRVQRGEHTFAADVSRLPTGAYQMRVSEGQRRSVSLGLIIR